MIIEDENTKVGENVGRMYNILALFFRKLLSCFLERTLAPNSSAMSVGRSVVGRLVVMTSVYFHFSEARQNDLPPPISRPIVR